MVFLKIFPCNLETCFPKYLGEKLLTLKNVFSNAETSIEEVGDILAETQMSCGF